MSPFWQLARRMLRYRTALTVAMVCAFLSAAGLGVGLVGTIPIFALILRGQKSLRDLAVEFNAGDPFVTVPQWIVQRIPEDPFGGVVFIMVPLAVLTVFGATMNFLHQYLSMTTAAKTVGHIRLEAFRHIVHLPLGRVVERGPAEFVARIVRDAEELQSGFVALVSRAVAHITKGAVAFFVAIAIQPGLTVIAVVVGVIVGIVLKRLGTRVRRGTRGALQAQEGLLRIATEVVQGLRSVKASTGEREGMRRFHRENKKVVREELRVRTARALSGPIVETLAVLAVGGVVIAAAALILRGAISPEQFVASLFALAIAGTSFRPLAGLINEMYAATAPAERLLDILEEPREVSASHRRLPRHHRSVAFDSVVLVYPGADRPALDGITLRIDHGERVALVGPNGSGKTTLVSLLPRLLRPTGGRVLVDEVDVESVSLRGLRRQIGVVTQETVLFRGTIAENIAFGLDGATREAVVDAARRARADEFIQRIPGGYDADVLEQGASLSGGQRQRLAIARAILRDPAILILDEATSQIDAESEARINDALAEFCRGRTAIVVAHRLATVLNADRIAVLDHGRLVDEGPHEELLERCDLYQRLTRTQLTGG